MPSLFRFSLRALLMGVTIAAVGLAALLNANGWWEAAAWMAAVFALASAVLLAAYRREQQRAFWLGFAVFGGTYLALVLYSFTADMKVDPIGDSLLRSANPLHYNSLATTRLTALAYQRALPESRQQEYASTPAGGTAAAAGPGAPFSSGKFVPLAPLVASGVVDGNDPSIGNVQWISTNLLTANPNYLPIDKFLSIGHTLWLLAIAAAGGQLCQFLYRTREPAVSPSSPPLES